MGRYVTAQSEWDHLHNKRSGMLDRCERFAEITIPSVCPDDAYDSSRDALTQGVTSLGAQCVTNLNNKLMLAMFPASKPFFRLAMTESEAQKFADENGITVDLLTDALAQGERDALMQLEMSGGREGLYEAVMHLIVTGNVLMDTRDKEALEFIPIKEYVVRRSRRGDVLTLVIKQELMHCELSEDVLKHVDPFGEGDPELKRCRYTWVRRVNGKFRVTEHIDQFELPYSKFGATYNFDDLPLHPLTWRLPLGQHYGVGRVEDYFHDFGTNETVNEALSDGAVMASQFRWLQNPTGITRPEDFQNSRNGDVIPGAANDLDLIFANVGQQLSTVLAIGQQYEKRLGTGFLLNSAVTRNAERVTAEEIRLQAIELESSLGGVYSRIARDVQIPLSKWLMRKADLSIKGTKLRPVVITGLDALSRNADLERLMQFLQNVTSLGGIPPNIAAMLQQSNIISDIAAGLGINKKRYVASDDEIQQRMAQMQQQATQGGDVATANTTPSEEPA
jgi:hypothetical protein